MHRVLFDGGEAAALVVAGIDFGRDNSRAPVSLLEDSLKTRWELP